MSHSGISRPYPFPVFGGGVLAYLPSEVCPVPFRAVPACTLPGCGEPGTGRLGRCVEHAREHAGWVVLDQQGYKTPEHLAFRAGVLDRDKVCQCRDLSCRSHRNRPCAEPATVADHWPLTRRQLVARGLDPNDPLRGRGLCASCHNRATRKLAARGESR